MLIFDFDGTLADTFSVGVEILNKLAEEFHFKHLEAHEVEHVRGMSVRQLIRFLGVPARKVPQISMRGVKEMRARIDTVKPIGDIIPVVRELHRRGFPMGIVTSNSEENVSYFLKRHHMECFDFIRCSSRLLGKAKVIRAVMREYQFKKEEVLLIGDEARDIEAAKRTRTAIVAVTWGYNTHTSLMEREPQYIVSHPSELLSLIATSGGTQ